MLKFFAEKMWVAFAVQKLLTFFSAKNIRILYIESTKIVNEMTLNELVKLTTLWTTGPWIRKYDAIHTSRPNTIKCNNALHSGHLFSEDDKFGLIHISVNP